MGSRFQLRARHWGIVILAATLSAIFATAVEASVEISTKPTQNMTCAGGVCTPTAKKAVLNAGDLASMLASGDVTIASGSLAQDIDIDAALSWTSTSRLTLNSYHAISFNKPVVVAGTGALTIKANDGGSGGDFRFFGKGHVEFWDTFSSLIINGQGYSLVSSMKQLRTAIKIFVPNIALVRSFSLARHTYRTAPIKSFGGSLEGLGNTISNLTIDDTNARDLVGLIAKTNFGGVIRDIGLKAVNIQGTTSEQLVGSLVGQNSGLILNSHATGSVTISGTHSFGAGLVGDNQEGTISHSYSAVTVSGKSGVFAIGGLVGANIGACSGSCDGIIDQSHSTGIVAGGDDAQVGGLVGSNIGGVITNSYASGAVEGGSSASVGGLIGANDVGNSSPVIASCYSTGAVSGGSGASVGGLIGQDLADPGITDAYWDMDTSGISNPAQGAGNIANDPGITGLTDAQLKSGLPAGFDKKVWKEKAGINNGYPYLIANPPQ